jgi:hypothetical protein
MILVFKKINYLAFMIGIVGKIFGCRVYYIGIVPGLSTNIGKKILQLLQFNPVSLSEIKFTDETIFYYRHCEKIKSTSSRFSQAISPAIKNIASYFQNITNLEHKLRIWYQKIMVHFYYRENEFLVWAEAMFPNNTKIYYFCSPIPKQFVESKTLQVVQVPFIELSFFLLVKKILIGLYALTRRIFIAVKFQFIQQRVECFSNQIITNQVLFFPHKSIYYGKLFRKDYYYSENLKSAFHITKIHHIEIGDSRGEWEIPENDSDYSSVDYTIFPGVRRIRKRVIVGSLKLLPFFYKALKNSQLQFFERIKLGLILWIMYTIFIHYRQILKPYSHAKIAIIGYDFLFSKGCSLALESYGIKTVAVMERMASVFTENALTSIGVYFVGSEYCIEQMKKRFSIHADQYIPVGQPRVDLFHKYSHLKDYGLVPEMKDGQKLVVALNFHSVTDPEINRLLPVISWEANKVFFNDVIELAEKYPNMFFLFRGKNSTWVDIPAFIDVMEKISSLENIAVDTDFDTLERSYMLCSSCDLIIARHTSLVDEAYAYGKQVIVHDYSHNSNRLIGYGFNYLDSGLFVRDKVSLHKLVGTYISTGSIIDPEVYESVRQKIFGNYSDGKVRERIRAIVERMLADAENDVDLTF